jgi:hypothetical protein
MALPISGPAASAAPSSTARPAAPPGAHGPALRTPFSASVVEADPTDIGLWITALASRVTIDQGEPTTFAARNRFFGATGEIHDDEAVFGLALALFHEWMIFDDLPESSRAALFGLLPPNVWDMDASRASLFEVVPRLWPARVPPSLPEGTRPMRLRDLATGKALVVFDRVGARRFRTGELLQARLYPLVDGPAVLSPHVLTHPPELRRPLRKAFAAFVGDSPVALRQALDALFLCRVTLERQHAKVGPEFAYEPALSGRFAPRPLSERALRARELIEKAARKS